MDMRPWTQGQSEYVLVGGFPNEGGRTKLSEYL